MFKQIQIIEMINSFSEKTIPIYSEIPKDIKQILNSIPNNDPIKLNELNKSFTRLIYYLKYLQIPQNKNYIIPSNITQEDREGECSCNLEYAEDIKKVCEQNDITIGIFGSMHIKCIKDILNNQTLNHNKTLKIISLLSDNILDLYNSAIKLKTYRRDCYETIKDTIEDSFFLNIQNVSKLGHDLFLKLIKSAHNSANDLHTPSKRTDTSMNGSVYKEWDFWSAHNSTNDSHTPSTNRNRSMNKKQSLNNTTKEENSPLKKTNSLDLRSLENILFNGELQKHPVKTKSQLRLKNLSRIAKNQFRKYKE